MTNTPSFVHRSCYATLAFAIVVGAAAGCGKTQPASFRLNMVQATKTSAPEADLERPWEKWSQDRQSQVATILLAMFGTPDEPLALAESGLDEAKLRLAAGPVRSDIVGRKNGLYREHCVHCHGISGDGMGPTAAFLNPYPRDYRPGKFKFKSTWRDAKPTSADLVRVLHEGIAGTSMPSFALLAPTQVDALAEYVRYLSIRGEAELALFTYAEQELGGDEQLPTTREFLVDEILTPIVGKWAAAEESQIPIAAVPAGVDFGLPASDFANRESVARGRVLFLGDGGCVKCHGVTALGDGQANDYDDWNKTIVEVSKEVAGSLDASRQAPTGELSPEKLAEHRARAEWLHAFVEVLEGDALRPRTIPPRNLRQGVYRGGRRPLDLYRRLYTGINGAPMPGVGPSGPGGKGSVADAEIWHIVNYIRSLPYEFDGELGADRPMIAKDRF
ncbi:MAG: cytochrome c [Planctomycetota bacterium]|jgi:mono/diheme cytochrome c family protein